MAFTPGRYGEESLFETAGWTTRCHHGSELRTVFDDTSRLTAQLFCVIWRSFIDSEDLRNSIIVVRLQKSWTTPTRLSGPGIFPQSPEILHDASGLRFLCRRLQVILLSKLIKSHEFYFTRTKEYSRPRKQDGAGTHNVAHDWTSQRKSQSTNGPVGKQKGRTPLLDREGEAMGLAHSKCSRSRFQSSDPVSRIPRST